MCKENTMICSRVYYLLLIARPTFFLLQRPKLERGKTVFPVIARAAVKLQKQNTSLDLKREPTVVELKPRPTMFQEKDEGKYSYVAAIEVGTSYSGYAFAPRSNGRLNIKEIGKLAGDGHFLIYIIRLKFKK